MKKLSRVMISIFSVFTLLVGNVITTVAAETVPEVIYDANTQVFTYKNADIHVGTDNIEYPNLFTAEKFTYAIPGDSLVQEIEVKTKHVSGNMVNIYLHSENEAQDYNEIMKSAILKVYYEGEEIAAGTLADGILLGTFTSDETRNITVEFGIPLEVGNEVASLYGTIDWVFVAELMEDNEKPQTDDSNRIVMWSVLALISFSGIIILKRRTTK